MLLEHRVDHDDPGAGQLGSDLLTKDVRQTFFEGTDPLAEPLVLGSRVLQVGAQRRTRDLSGGGEATGEPGDGLGGGQLDRGP